MKLRTLQAMRPRGPLGIHEFLSRLLLLLLLALSTACAPLAQAGSGVRHYSQAELDQMLAPIALYPDALLSQILMAATYPLEVVEAAHWSAENPGYQGSQAVQAVEMDTRLEWDPSVKSLVAFPQLLKRMEDNIEWTQRLGVAFVYQQGEVMDTVQSLRRRAMEQGNLRSSDQIYVYPQGQIITVEPANPQIVYVPYYDPNVVYGAWWWGGYPPVYWSPWPGYYSAPYSRPGISSGLIWGSGIAVGTTFFFGMFDWREHHVHVHPDYRDRYDTRWHDRRPPPPAGPAPIWRHDPERRPATPYRGPAPQLLPQPPSVRPSGPPPTMQPVPHDDSYRNHRDPGDAHDRRSPGSAPQYVPPPGVAIPAPGTRTGRPERSAPAPVTVPDAPRERGPVQPRLGPATRPEPSSVAPTPLPAAAAPAPVTVRPAPVAPRPQGSGVIREVYERAAAQNPQVSDSPRGRPESAPPRTQDRPERFDRSDRSDRGDRGDRGGRDRGDGPGDGRQR